MGLSRRSALGAWRFGTLFLASIQTTFFRDRPMEQVHHGLEWFGNTSVSEIFNLLTFVFVVPILDTDPLARVQL